MVSCNDEFELDHPAASVLSWCTSLVSALTDGGIWGIPRSETVFKVDKQKKQLILVQPGNDDDADFFATQKVFKHIGWEVIRQHGTEQS
jgi:hypothetical protein